MGACVSKKDRSELSRKKVSRRRRRVLRRRISSGKVEISDSCGQIERSRRSVDGVWFDSTSVFESEWDDEFYSVHEDGVSLNGSEIGEVRLSDVREISFVGGDEDGDEDETTAVDHCGMNANACLPCLVSNTVAPSDGTPSSRKKSTLKLSFKWKEGNSNLTLFSPKALRHRPIAGSSVPYCPIDKKMPNCWSPIEPSTFKVRGQNYLRDKKKDSAASCAAFYPFGVDIFMSPRKIDHVARFVELPSNNLTGEVPSILVVNLQIPLYPAAIFQSENDGEGMNMVLYFKVSENYSKDLPSNFRENIIKFINDEVERVKGFPMDTIAPFRERLKILGRAVNMDELRLSAAEKKLMNAYNEKPVLSRPQHEFYLGVNYLEIDLDMHRFSYISRKGFEAFQERLKLCVLDFGLTIQGNKAEDLPENILCCVRLNEIDYNTYHQLGV